MAQEIRFPRLGWSMEDGRFVGWLKENGQHIQEGEPLFEMEGEKAVQEIESIGSGILYRLPTGPTPETVVTVGCLLGYLLEPGEEPPQTTPPEPLGSTQADSPRTDLPNTMLSTGMTQIDQNPSEGKQILATPRARRLAKEFGIDWRMLRGTGRADRIREVDIKRYAENVSKTQGAVLSQVFTSRRKSIAERLTHSRQKTIPVTLHTRCDATGLVNYRKHLKSTGVPLVASFNDLIAKRLVVVLGKHPAMRVRWKDDHSDLEIVEHLDCHIGLAVDTPEGLLVPVIRDLSNLELDQIASQSLELISIARSGRLTRSQMQGGVITLTNLGSYGIDAFTPIINYPEIAILGIGAIRKEPVFMEDLRLEARHIMSLSLTFDHAAIDGAPAAAFLKAWVEDLESFEG
jgi:pyruvate dehydrogenase E2 component (dihydrolipoamide acetyltransferase)